MGFLVSVQPGAEWIMGFLVYTHELTSSSSSIAASTGQFARRGEQEPGEDEAYEHYGQYYLRQLDEGGKACLVV